MLAGMKVLILKMITRTPLHTGCTLDFLWSHLAFSYRALLCKAFSGLTLGRCCTQGWKTNGLGKKSAVKMHFVVCSLHFGSCNIWQHLQCESFLLCFIQTVTDCIICSLMMYESLRMFPMKLISKSLFLSPCLKSRSSLMLSNSVCFPAASLLCVTVVLICPAVSLFSQSLRKCFREVRLQSEPDVSPANAKVMWRAGPFVISYRCIFTLCVEEGALAALTLGRDNLPTVFHWSAGDL